jgi:hypothetical protein
MESTRDQFLPCSALSLQENGRGRVGNRLDQPEHFGHLAALPDEVLECLLDLEGALQIGGNRPG